MRSKRTALRTEGRLDSKKKEKRKRVMLAYGRSPVTYSSMAIAEKLG